jgi:DNA-binding IclR family transcriptional regulator
MTIAKPGSAKTSIKTNSAKKSSAKPKPAPRLPGLANKARPKTVPSPQELPSGRVTHQSLERGLHVLETIAATGSLISLGEASRRTGLHRSTTHHLLQSLVGVGYVRQDKTSRGYELTSKLFELTGRMWTPEQLGEIAQPFVADLTGISGEGASMAAYRDGVVSIVAKRDAEGPVRVAQSVGAERPIHATAVAKAIVAFLPEAELKGLLLRLRYESYAPRTITTQTAFVAELQRVRTSGFAYDDEEHMEGLRCIAAPVFAYTGRAVGSLCVVGPRSRMTRQKLRELRPGVLATCKALSKRLGWRGTSAGG